MTTITITLHANRSIPGILSIVSDGSEPFHCACFGKSDQAAAEEHNNPTRDPLKPFGDIPTGNYIACPTVAASGSASDLRSYGPNGRVVLNPRDGNAFLALQNGRHGLLIHGGAPAPNGGFRPTHGCIRVFDLFMPEILNRIGTVAAVQIVEV